MLRGFESYSMTRSARRSSRSRGSNCGLAAIARQVAANAPETTRDLARTLRIKRAELQPVLERDSRKQAESYASAEFHKRIASYFA